MLAQDHGIIMIILLLLFGCGTVCSGLWRKRWWIIKSSQFAFLPNKKVPNSILSSVIWSIATSYLHVSYSFVELCVVLWTNIDVRDFRIFHSFWCAFMRLSYPSNENKRKFVWILDGRKRNFVAGFWLLLLLYIL